MSVTRLNGQLTIFHKEGRIEFKLRSDKQILRRGTDTILTIENAGLLPQLDSGKEFYINLLVTGLDVINAQREIPEAGQTGHRPVTKGSG